MEGGTRAGTISLSDRPGIRALIKIMESVNSGESWTIYIQSLQARWPYLPSFREANHFPLSDDFRPRLGVVNASLTLSSPARFFFIGLGYPPLPVSQPLRQDWSGSRSLAPSFLPRDLHERKKRVFLREIAPHLFCGVSRCCLLYTSPSPRDQRGSRMPSSA